MGFKKFITNLISPKGIDKSIKPNTAKFIIIDKDEYNQSAYYDISSIFEVVDSNGQRFETVEKMLYDDVLSQNLDIINNHVKALNWNLTGDSEQIKFIQRCFDNINFNQFLENQLVARVKGFSMYVPRWIFLDGLWEVKEMIFLESSAVQIETNKYNEIEKILVNGKEYPLSKFWLYTNNPTAKSKFYGTSIFERIYREWYTKDLFKRYENSGIENYTHPLVIVKYLASEYQEGSQKFEALNEILNFQDGTRLGLPQNSGVDGGLENNLTVEKIEFDSKGLELIRSAIQDNNKAMTRSMGVPLEWDNEKSGNNAKMVEINKEFAGYITATAIPIEANTQKLITMFLAYNFETPNVQFHFDFNQERGITKDKAEILEKLTNSGYKFTREKVADFLDINIDDIVEEQAIVTPTAIETFETKPLVIPKANTKRIEKKLNSIELDMSERLAVNIESQLTKANKKIDVYIDDVKKLEKAFGTLNQKNKKIFAEMLFESYFYGKDEAYSELEKQNGFNEVETFETAIMDKTTKAMFIKTFENQEVGNELISDFENDTETFEAGAMYLVGTWLKDWLRRTGRKLNKTDKLWLKHVGDFAYTLSQDMNSLITKIYRDTIITQLGQKTKQEIVANINKRIETAGLTKLNPHYLKTAVNTASGQYFNNARQAQFLDPDLVNSGFVKAFRYSAVMDKNTTPFCSEHDGMIIDITDPLLAEITPTNHFNCRSILEPITKYYYDKSKVNFRMGSTKPAVNFGGG